MGFSLRVHGSSRCIHGVPRSAAAFPAPPPAAAAASRGASSRDIAAGPRIWDADTVPEGHYRQLSALEVAKLVRAVEHALTQPKPILAASKPRRSWRPRRVMSKSKEGVPRKKVP